MKKKNKICFTYADRGPTFVGFAPKIEAGKRERMEKQFRKHKAKSLDY